MVRMRVFMVLAVVMLAVVYPLNALARDEVFVATPGPVPTPAPTPAPVDFPYRIYVEKGAYTLQVYGKDESGEYNVPIHSFLVALGSGSKTPTGTFKILGKERWHAFNSSSETRKFTYVQYATRFTGGLYIHSPLYTAKTEDTMISASYKEIGTKSTSGCLRMSAGAAHWIYENCPEGTEIVIVSDAPLGLKGEKLPDVTERGKDPTDPKYAVAAEEEERQLYTLSLDKPSMTLKVGDTIKLCPTLSPRDSSVLLDWSVSDAGVLSVDADGRVTALKRGAAKVTVLSMQHNLSVECEVTVK